MMAGVMTTFQVWAPLPERVELLLPEGRRLAMEPADGGWWTVQADAPGETRYAFSLDGGPPRPDPRSARLPDGVHGWSQQVEHESFPWTDAPFRATPWPQQITYELHVGTFTPDGTFDAAAERLPYLLELGITHVSLMPCNAFPGQRGWGYDGVGLFAVYERYGGPDGLKRFVNAAHAAGIGVVMDVVYNHFGPTGNYLPEFGPYLTRRYRTPWGDGPNLDGPHSDEVREFMVANAVMWVRDYHVDGLRLDAIDHVYDASALHFVEELSTRVKAARPGVVLVGEAFCNDPRFFRAPSEHGHGLDAIWSDDMHNAIHTAATDERTGYYADYDGVAKIAKCLGDGWNFDGGYSHYRKRRHGRPARGARATNFMAYTQTHDQVGNRATGDRLCNQAGHDRAAAAAAVVLLGVANPMLFMGEEWAAGTAFQYFCHHEDPALAKAVRTGRCREFAAFGWKPKDIPDPEAEATFLRSKLDWSELEDAAKVRMLDWYRALIAMRKRHVGGRARELCRAGDVAFDEDGEWVRFAHSGMTVVACFAAGGAAVPLDRIGRGEPGVAWGEPEVTGRGDRLVFGSPGAAAWDAG